MSTDSPLILIAAGGTGGHVYPALAVAQELLARGYRVQWVGTRAGLEHRVVPANDIVLHFLPVKGVRGKRLAQRMRATLLMVLALFRSAWLLLRLRPACVVGMGGYVAGPPGLAAWLLRKPLLLHEQNAVAGTTNRMLAPFARRIACGFAGAFAQGPKVTVTGNPLRRELVAAGADKRYDYDGTRPLRLLVLGGSLGATPINDIVPATVRRLQRSGSGSIEVLHQTGERDFDAMLARYDNYAQGNVRAVAFIEDMAAAYAWADLVLSRAGALTVSELAVMGRPSILVPLPRAIDDHQTANARSLASAGAAMIMLQSELDSYRLGMRIGEFKAHPEQLSAMSAAAYAVATPAATARVCDFCAEWCDD